MSALLAARYKGMAAQSGRVGCLQAGMSLPQSSVCLLLFCSRPPCCSWSKPACYPVGLELSTSFACSCSSEFHLSFFYERHYFADSLMLGMLELSTATGRVSFLQCDLDIAKKLRRGPTVNQQYYVSSWGRLRRPSSMAIQSLVDTEQASQ